MEAYYEFVITCNQARAEMVIAELAAIHFEGFVEQENGFSAFIPHIHFKEDEFSEILARYSIDVGDVQKSSISPQNWNAEWEKQFEPITVEGQIMIRAPFHPADKAYPYDLVIQPKNTFGTGHHETTRLVLTLMLKEEMRGREVFDYGCGTGVLGIFAAKAGAKHIGAIDIDEWCAGNISENMQLNRISNLSFTKTDLDTFRSERKFDLVVANINKNILLRSFKKLASFMTIRGSLIISGFYETDLQDLAREALHHHFHFHEQITENNWCAASFNYSVLT